MLLTVSAELVANEPVIQSLRVMPDALTLSSPEASDQIIVWGVTPDGELRDLTAAASFQPAQSGIVKLAPGGVVSAVDDGVVDIEVRAAGQSAVCRIEVQNVTHPIPVSFTQHVLPVLSKAGCNSGACHGKAEGQNGFKLSVFGYDSNADHEAIVFEGVGRRVFPASPERSLFLRKATGVSPHGGGRRIEPDSRWYRIIERWIAEGTRRDEAAAEQRVVNIEVQPPVVELSPLSQQQLRVVALMSDGSRHGVTAECDFQTNHAPVADVDEVGRITATEVPGEAGILVRYQGHVGVCRVIQPLANSEFQPTDGLGEIDQRVWDKLQVLGLPASELCSDEVFLRRIYLDMIGTLPNPDEVRQFLNDSSVDKRARLVDRLFARPEYTDYWAQKWADLLRVDKDVLTPRGAAAMTRWLRDAGQTKRGV